MKKDFGKNPWFYPLPVLIVGTYDKNGNADAMNAAWGGLYGADMVELCLSESHKTTKNIKEKKAFTVSFADAANLKACDYVGIVSANSTADKMAKSGLTTEKSRFVDAPVINDFLLFWNVSLLVHRRGHVLGRIVNIAADESVLDDKGSIDLTKFKPITYEPVNHGYYVVGEKVGQAFSDGNALK